MNESLSTIVNFEDLNGTWPYELGPFKASKALTHSFKAKSDLLISAPSVYLSLLLFWQSEALSLPAKSTKSNLPGFLIPSS